MSFILVTGGAKRLGREISKGLALQGHNVAIHYQSSGEEAEETVEECRELGVEVAMIQGDFSTAQGVDCFLLRYRAQIPETKALVNNVGPYLMAPLMETSTEQWRDLFQTNVHAPFALSKGLLPLESIVNIGMAGLHRVDPKRSAYLMAKSTLWHLTRSMAKELAAQGTSVNMVSPGYLENSTDMPADFPAMSTGTAVPCGQVVSMLNYLLDPVNSHLTGQNIEIAGGVGL